MMELVPLKRVARLNYGSSLPAENRQPGIVSVYSSGGESGTHNRANTGSPAIVIGRKGSHGSIHWANDGAFVIDTAYYIDDKSTQVDLRWLFYVLQTIDLRGSSQDVGVPGLSREAAHNLLVPTPPPRSEQRRIADFLHEQVKSLSRMQEVRSKQLDALAERFAFQLDHALFPNLGRTLEQHREWPWLPADAKMTKLGHCAHIQGGLTVDASRSRTDNDITLPYLRVANVQAGRLDLREVSTITVSREMVRRSRLHVDDVLMTEANGNIDNLGRGAVWDGSIPHCLHQNHLFAVRPDPQKLNPHYLAALLASTHGRLYFRHTATQVGIATTSSSKVRGFPIPSAPRDKQDRIVQEITAMRTKHDRLSALIQEQIALLSEKRSAFITAAVAGRSLDQVI